MNNFTEDLKKLLPHYLLASLCIFLAVTIANVSSSIIIRNFIAKNPQTAQRQAMNGKLPSEYKIGKQYTEVIKDTTKPLVVEFYADWCPHCKRITPVFAKTAKKVTSVNFASVNAEAQENKALTSQYNVDKFPFFIIINTKTGEYEEFNLNENSFTPLGLKAQIEELASKYSN